MRLALLVLVAVQSIFASTVTGSGQSRRERAPLAQAIDFGLSQLDFSRLRLATLTQLQSWALHLSADVIVQVGRRRVRDSWLAADRVVCLGSGLALCVGCVNRCGWLLLGHEIDNGEQHHHAVEHPVPEREGELHSTRSNRPEIYQYSRRSSEVRGDQR